MYKYSLYVQHHIGNEIDYINSEIIGTDSLEEIYEDAAIHARMKNLLLNEKEYVYFIFPLPPGTAEMYNAFCDEDYKEFEDNEDFLGMCF